MIRVLNLFTIMNRGGAETMVMNYYRANPEYFAGGKKAAPTNFPFCKELMNIVETYFLKRGIID